MTQHNKSYVNGFCAHGFFVGEPGECVFCEYGEDVVDGECPNCKASTWHQKRDSGESICLACSDIHPYVEGILGGLKGKGK
jgi:hypothetical protein